MRNSSLLLLVRSTEALHWPWALRGLPRLVASEFSCRTPSWCPESEDGLVWWKLRTPSPDVQSGWPGVVLSGQPCEGVAEQRIKEVFLLTGPLHFFSVHLVVYFLPWHCILRGIGFHFFFFFLPHWVVCGILFPPSGIKPVPLQLKLGFLTAGSVGSPKMPLLCACV